MTVEVPSFSAETRPVELTEATDAVPTDHVVKGSPVIFAVEPSLNVAVAVYCCWEDWTIEAVTGVTSTDVTETSGNVSGTVTSARAKGAKILVTRYRARPNLAKNLNFGRTIMTEFEKKCFYKL
jgi:hypothetical protein